MAKEMQCELRDAHLQEKNPQVYILTGSSTFRVRFVTTHTLSAIIYNVNVINILFTINIDG